MYRFYRLSRFINRLPGFVPIMRTSLMMLTRTSWLPFKKRIVLVNYLAHHLTRSPKKIVQLEVPHTDMASAAAAPLHFKMSVDMRYSLARRLFVRAPL